MRLPEGGLRISPVVTVKGCACFAILLGIYASYLVGHQAYHRALKSHIAWRAEQVHSVENWQRIMSLHAEVQHGLLQGEKPVMAFSPAHFQHQGVRLVSWVPSDSGGEMSLEAPWQQVPPLFLMLAERSMQVVDFSLRAEKEALSLTFQLVRHDAP